MRDPRGLIANRIHIHGVHFVETGTDAGPTPLSAQVRGTTVNVVPGTTRDLEVVADAPGDWSMHRHKSHHTMNQMAMGQSRKVAERSRKEKRREPQQQCLQHGGTD